MMKPLADLALVLTLGMVLLAGAILGISILTDLLTTIR